MKAASTSRSSCTGPTASKRGGGLRDQFHHVNDIVPTIYETVGVEAPSTYRGLEQLPVSGVSMRYSFDAPDDPSRKQVQYYEMMGHRAIYADGWKAVTRHQPGVPFEDDDWELYHLAADRSECHNLAAVDARQGGRDGRTVVGRGRGAGSAAARRPDHRAVRRPATATGRPIRPTGATPTSRPCRRCPVRWHPPLGGRGWDMAAVIERPEGAGGVLYATGTENSGVSLFVQDGRLVFDYNCFGDHHVVESEVDVPVGPSVVGVRFRRTGKGGSATLLIDGHACGNLDVPFVMTHDLQRGPEHRLRPRLTGERALLRALPLRRPARAARRDPGPSRRRRSGKPGPRPNSGRPCPASEAGPDQPVNLADAPASTSMTEPVMWRAASDAR